MQTRVTSVRSPEDPSLMTIGEFLQDRFYTIERKRSAPNFLLILTLGGRGRATASEGSWIEVQCGDILLYRPSVYHFYGTAPGADSWSLAWSHFVPPSTWTFWENWEPAFPGLLHCRIDPEGVQRVREALACAHHFNLQHDELLSHLILNCLQRAFLFIEDSLRGAQRRPQEERVAKALRLIRQHLETDLSIPRLARFCGLSVSRFAHLFRAVVGMPPQRFIEEQRMEKARQLLRDTNLSVAQVAEACGFSDPFYFSTRFRKAAGSSPLRYRVSIADQRPERSSSSPA